MDLKDTVLDRDLTRIIDPKTVYFMKTFMCKNGYSFLFMSGS